MRYGRLTVEVIFTHDDSVPAPIAAARLVSNIDRGDVIMVTGVNLETVTERDVVQASGGCGECAGCQETIAEMVVPGLSDVAPSAAEDAAIQRAQGA
jgi:hypothetical protein